jgi:Sec-independent protein translocase protein TatA
MDLLLILIVILILVVVWRGPKTLPLIGNALGRGIREARQEATKGQDEIQATTSGEPAAPPSGPDSTEPPAPTSPS